VVLKKSRRKIPSRKLFRAFWGSAVQPEKKSNSLALLDDHLI
jgi:hypothetical protein